MIHLSFQEVIFPDRDSCLPFVSVWLFYHPSAADDRRRREGWQQGWEIADDNLCLPNATDTTKAKCSQKGELEKTDAKH